jgi:tetratricopeptide (TPR) repeat protein
VVFFLCFVSLSTAAIAGEQVDTGEEEGKKTAREYFARGELLFDNGEYAQAAELFVLAYKESPHPVVLANVALSYDKAGKLPQAVTAYREYLANQDDPEMQSRLDELEKQVGELHVTCSEGEGCSIRVDGIARGGTPLVLVVYPGPHQVEATAKGRSPITQKTRVEAGERVQVPMEVNPLPEAEPQSEGSEQKEEKNAPYGLGIPFWVSVGVTGAAGTVAIVFGAITVNDKKEFEDSGKTDEDLKEKGESHRLVTNVMIGVTAAAALTAAGFAIYDLVYKKDRKEKQDRAHVAIVPGPGLGVGAVLTF